MFGHPVALSHDGSFLVAADDDGTILIYDSRTGRLRRSLKGHTEWVKTLALNGDSTVLASGDEGGTVRLWDLRAGSEITSVKLHDGSHVRSVTIDASASLLVSSGENISGWKILGERLELVYRLEGIDDWGSQVSISADGELLAFEDPDYRLTIHDAHTGKKVAACDKKLGGEPLALSGDGSVGVSTFDERIVLWRPRSGRRVRALADNSDKPTSVAFSPDGGLFASAAEYSGVRIRIWDGRSATWLQTIEPQTSRFSNGRPVVAFAADGRTLLSVCELTEVWSARAGERLGEIVGVSQWAGMMAISCEPCRLAAPCRSGIGLWDVASRRQIRVLDTEGDRPSALAMSYSGTYVIVGTDKGALLIWDANSGERVARLETGCGVISGVAVSIGDRVVACGSAGASCVFDLDSMHVIADRVGAGPVNSVAVSSSEPRAAMACRDGVIRVIELESCQVVAECRGHSGSVTSVAFCPDREFILSGGTDGLKLWSAEDGVCVATWIITEEGDWLAYTSEGYLSGSKSLIARALLEYESGGVRTKMDGDRTDRVRPERLAELVRGIVKRSHFPKRIAGEPPKALPSIEDLKH